MQTRLTAKWVELTKRRLRERILTEPEIRILRLRLRTMANDRTAKWATAYEELTELVHTVRPLVSPEQARKGADWLRYLAFTKVGGTRRATDAARQFSETDLHVLRECYRTPKFALIGFEEQVNGYGHLSNLAPVYRCYGGGMHFDYVASSWQSGGGFAIVQHAYRLEVAA